ncbi:MAG TPA: helix-turn-helix domain-containing protein [Thermoleophilaceae bacterium]
MPQAIGDTLREARMRQKIDITEIESKTKIRAKYLRAMENEEFDLLPGSTFAKSFLRTYAEALGLDAHRLVEEYRAQYEPRDEGDLLPLAGQAGRRPGRDRRYERRRPGRAAAIVAILVAVVVVLFVVGVFSNDNNSSENAGTTPTTTTKEKKKHKSSGKSSTTPKRVVLRVTPTVPTYMCVDHGKGKPPVFQGITDQPQTWKGRHIRLNLGKTSVTITANGKRVALVQSPNPAGLDFTPGKHKDIPVGSRPCS